MTGVQDCSFRRRNGVGEPMPDRKSGHSTELEAIRRRARESLAAVVQQRAVVARLEGEGKDVSDARNELIALILTHRELARQRERIRKRATSFRVRTRPGAAD